MHKLNVFIKEHGLWIETELLSMAITGDRCVVLAQDRVAIAWLVVEEGRAIWTVFDKGLDLFDDPRIEHSHRIKCTHDGTCQFQAKM